MRFHVKLTSGIAVCVALAATSVVCADLRPVTNATDSSAFESKLAVEPVIDGSAAARPVELERQPFAQGFPWVSEVLPTESAGLSDNSKSSTGEVLTLPADRSSASLFLSALAGLGLWQLGRSAKNLHLGALPEWYHDGGPTQVGHATPLDLEFSLAAMPVCPFDSLVKQQPPIIPLLLERQWWIHETVVFVVKSRHIPPTIDPRGPPFSA